MLPTQIVKDPGASSKGIAFLPRPLFALPASPLYLPWARQWITSFVMLPEIEGKTRFACPFSAEALFRLLPLPDGNSGIRSPVARPRKDSPATGSLATQAHFRVPGGALIRMTHPPAFGNIPQPRFPGFCGIFVVCPRNTSRYHTDSMKDKLLARFERILRKKRCDAEGIFDSRPCDLSAVSIGANFWEASPRHL